VTLRFVGLLSHSIFQGEVLIAEERFVEAFPRVTGRGFFLFAAAPADAPLLAAGLEKDLGDRGLDVEATADLLAAYEAVENTYLSTFQVLGALGLLLGTAGLGAIVLRNVNERRGELALLQAVGFPRRSIAVLVASETAFLLGLGLAAGAGAALIAILPALRGAAAPAWEGLALSLAAVLACGLLSSALAVRAALRAPLIPSLRRE
jgi:ABC-type antimicrobial peptide transport system permease subunit